ncbi:unnamed protein product [Prorocentrum cordatum]|uniref:Secreted protein n=1 Tax=Prorocentrum cordatum TaxID=2364126 RepID=A0ABN9PW56_9DINO|nr:unnamed protein product [Polarella glacialis]
MRLFPPLYIRLRVPILVLLSPVRLFPTSLCSTLRSFLLDRRSPLAPFEHLPLACQRGGGGLASWVATSIGDRRLLPVVGLRGLFVALARRCPPESGQRTC